MWLLVVNGLVYLGFVYLHGEWRDLVPRRGDAAGIREMVKFYLFARHDHPKQGKHNALQRTAYFVMPVVGILIVLSGIAIWKPVQLHWLCALFGGYVWARYVHFVMMVALVLLVLGHVFMVLSVDPYALRAIITGWYNESRSPEARNARPFYHLLARGAPADANPKAPGHMP
jgi:thiosulfate reductase cytochrome b subunit